MIHEVRSMYNNSHQSLMDQYGRSTKINDDDLSSDDGYHGFSPPPPLTNDVEFDEFEGTNHRRDSTYSSIDGGVPTVMYCDVGEEISITIQLAANEEIGITLLMCQSFSPSLPAILDIKKSSAACSASPKIKIGDQIKEINGILTEGLSICKITALFSTIKDSLQLVLRRGMEPTKRDFDWFKFPFLSVSKDAEEIVITTSKVAIGQIYHSELTTFQESRTHVHDLFEGKQRFDDRKVQDGPHNKHVRSLSASATCRSTFLLKERQRRKTVQEICTTKELSNSLSLIGSTNKCTVSKSIADEVEIRRLKFRKSSQSSLTSSTTTISSTNSTSEIVDVNRDLVNEGENLDVSAKSLHKEHFPHMIRTPVNKLRDSFRKRVKNKTNSSNDNNIIHEQPYENTLSVTVWIPDRRRLGIKLGGGSVSPYGDNNISIVDVKKTGTAYKILRSGDEILEVDGKLTYGLDLYQVNDLLKKLEGNYVELKVFRPNKIQF